MPGIPGRCRPNSPLPALLSTRRLLRQRVSGPAIRCDHTTALCCCLTVATGQADPYESLSSRPSRRAMYGQRMRNLSFLFAVAALFTGLNAPLASVASRGPIFDDSGVEAEPVAVANGSQGSARTSPGSCDGALTPAIEPDPAFEVAIADVELRLPRRGGDRLHEKAASGHPAHLGGQSIQSGQQRGQSQGLIHASAKAETSARPGVVRSPAATVVATFAAPIEKSSWLDYSRS